MGVSMAKKTYERKITVQIADKIIVRVYERKIDVSKMAKKALRAENLCSHNGKKRSNR